MKTSVCTLVVWLSVSVVFAQAQCIGVITAGGGQSYWQDVERGAMQAASELGLRIYTRGPADEVNVQAQQVLIDWVVNLGCRGLILAPNSSQHLETIAQLKLSGIPTVFVDRDIGGDRVSVIQTNNDLAGRLAGEQMVAALGGEGKVAVFRMDPMVRTTTIREDAFIRAVTAAGLSVVIDDHLGTRVGRVREKAYQLLLEHPDVNGIFTPNESTTVGTLAAVNQLGREHPPVLIGFDASPMLTNAVKSGKVLGLVVQSPYQMGYQGVHTVSKAMRGDDVASHYDVPTWFLTQTNLDAAGRAQEPEAAND